MSNRNWQSFIFYPFLFSTSVAVKKNLQLHLQNHAVQISTSTHLNFLPTLSDGTVMENVFILMPHQLEENDPCSSRVAVLFHMHGQIFRINHHPTISVFAAGVKVF